MKEKNKKLVEFIKTHKKAIIAATGAVVTGGVMFVLARRNAKLEGLGDLPIPELETGKILMLWREWANKKNRVKCINVIGNELTVADMGRFGAELGKIEGIEPTNHVDFVITILQK